jgi:hypothetical protein
MEQIATQTYCQRAALELAALIKHQRKPSGRVRRNSMLLRTYVMQTLAAISNAAEELTKGPWHVGTRPLKRRGRGGLPFIPTAQNGDTVVMVSTTQEAEELVAFLNLCGMSDFPVR